jgi:hypothetical protein
VPTAPQHEIHVDGVGLGIAAGAVPFSVAVGRVVVERNATSATDFACQTLPGR